MAGQGIWPHLGIKSGLQQELLDYWDSRCVYSAMPARADIDPIDIPHLLPHIGLIDVLGGGIRFRYRLVGTHLAEVFGTDFTGTYLDQAVDRVDINHLLGLYKRCAQGPRIVYSESEFSYRDRSHLWVSRLLLPLSSDGMRVNMLMFSEVFTSKYLRDTAEEPSPVITDAIVGVREIARHEAGVV